MESAELGHDDKESKDVRPMIPGFNPAQSGWPYIPRI